VTTVQGVLARGNIRDVAVAVIVRAISGKIVTPLAESVGDR
jgi:large-conductance mechanosensitive channel